MSSLEERVRSDNEMAARAGTLPPPVYLEDEVEIIEQATRNVEEGEEEDDTDRLIDGLTDGSDEVVVVPAAGGVRDSRTGRIGGNNVRVATRRRVNGSRRIPPSLTSTQTMGRRSVPILCGVQREWDGVYH